MGFLPGCLQLGYGSLQGTVVETILDIKEIRDRDLYINYSNALSRSANIIFEWSELIIDLIIFLQ